jgi:hypothetical protein
MVLGKECHAQVFKVYPGLRNFVVLFGNGIPNKISLWVATAKKKAIGRVNEVAILLEGLRELQVITLFTS